MYALYDLCILCDLHDSHDSYDSHDFYALYALCALYDLYALHDLCDDLYEPNHCNVSHRRGSSTIAASTIVAEELPNLVGSDVRFAILHT